MSTHGDVGVSVGDDHVAIVEVRRPPDNFFDADLISSIADAYGWAEEQAGARAIVLCSQGKNFCAGANFNARTASTGTASTGTASTDTASTGTAIGAGGALYQMAVRLFEAKLPVVAAVQGAAVGGGLGLACSADFRVASPRSKFAANFARLGLHQGFGLSVMLPAIVGQQAAMDLLYTGRRVGGAEALRIGLVDRLADEPVDSLAGEPVDSLAGVPVDSLAGVPVDSLAGVPQAGLRAIAHELARQIAGSAPLAVRSIRATLRAGLADRVRQAMDNELTEQGRLWQTADFAEGVRAYAERRPPEFEGR